MVKLTGPGLARAASGSLAEQLTFSNWKDVAYLKQHRKPTQPRSPAQKGMRAMMSFLSARWKTFAPVVKGYWEIPAAAKNISPFNAFLAVNLTRWRSHLGPSPFYPAFTGGAIGGIDTRTIIDGVRSMTIRWRVTALGDIWGMCLHLVPASGQPSTWDNLLHVTSITGIHEHTQLLTGLAAGAYWIRQDRILLTGEIPPFPAYRCGNVTDT